MSEFACRNVVDRGQPVLYAVHDQNGDWQMLCGGSEHDEDNAIVILHKEHLQQSDPTLAQVFDLPLGWEASRDSAAAAWVRAPFVEDEESEPSAAHDGGPEFGCTQCGRTHRGLLTDRAWKLPDDVWAIPEPERENAAHFTSDLCEMDGRFFIRCILYVPFTEREGAFGWGVWVEVARDDFERCVELYAVEASAEPPKPGTLANVIDGYPGSARERVMIQFGTPADRPHVRMLAGSGSLLAREQARGIDDRRYHEILVEIGAI